MQEGIAHGSHSYFGEQQVYSTMLRDLIAPSPVWKTVNCLNKYIRSIRSKWLTFYFLLIALHLHFTSSQERLIQQSTTDNELIFQIKSYSTWIWPAGNILTILTLVENPFGACEMWGPYRMLNPFLLRESAFLMLNYGCSLLHAVHLALQL